MTFIIIINSSQISFMQAIYYIIAFLTTKHPSQSSVFKLWFNKGLKNYYFLSCRQEILHPRDIINRAANNGWWPIITSHFCIITDQIFWIVWWTSNFVWKWNLQVIIEVSIRQLYYNLTNMTSKKTFSLSNADMHHRNMPSQELLYFGSRTQKYILYFFFENSLI